MDEKDNISSSGCEEEEEMDLRRGPWTVEEDMKLINYIATNGEGRWNSLACCAGLKRTGKSCRLRWLNYLRPDVRRGNITLEEQLLILELHSRWGNRWSKIAQHLPGRTDNEIKNYWRTRVQKHAKQLKCDTNSKQFKDTVRYLWMPRLVERIQAAAASTSSSAADTSNPSSTVQVGGRQPKPALHAMSMVNTYTPENSSTPASSDSFGAQVSPVSDITDNYYTGHVPVSVTSSNPDEYLKASAGQVAGDYSDFLIPPPSFSNNVTVDYYGRSTMDQNTSWTNDCDGLMNQGSCYTDDVWTFLQQQLN